MRMGSSPFARTKACLAIARRFRLGMKGLRPLTLPHPQTPSLGEGTRRQKTPFACRLNRFAPKSIRRFCRVDNQNMLRG